MEALANASIGVEIVVFELVRERSLIFPGYNAVFYRVHWGILTGIIRDKCRQLILLVANFEISLNVVFSKGVKRT